MFLVVFTQKLVSILSGMEFHIDINIIHSSILSYNNDNDNDNDCDRSYTRRRALF